MANTIEVSASYDSPTTKGGHADLLPVALKLRPFLEEALRASGSALVFPRSDGAMQSRDLALDKVLRRALGRAGIVIGYLHKCRRKHCGYEVRRDDDNCGRCPRCDMRLWAKALPRHVRFHDLRHTTATLLLKQGVSLATVQRVLRHTDPRLTSEIYGHLDVDDMRAGVDRLAIETGELSAGPELHSAEPAPKLLGPLGAPVVRSDAASRATRLLHSLNHSDFEGKNWSGRQDSNLRPPGPEPGALPG